MKNWPGWIRHRKPFIVAELCTNIFPYSRLKLVEGCQLARQAGADAVKVQLYFSDHFPEEEQAAKQETVFPRAELGFFAETARIAGMAWGASVFDRGAVDMLANMGADFLKLATREQYNQELREYANRKFNGTILRSVIWPYHIPCGYYRMPREVTLACVPKYPIDMGRALKELPFARYIIGPWGWSSHTNSGEDCAAAAGLGASVVEKHLRLSPDDLEANWSVSGEHLGAIVEACKKAGK